MLANCKSIIRCDDVFVDSDANHIERICEIIRRNGFDHLVGITPLGEGTKLSFDRDIVWKMPLARNRLLVNRLLLKKTGEEFIGTNLDLLKTLNAEFRYSNTIPALHGLHHYRYDVLSMTNVFEELSNGIRILKNLFNVDVKIFIPPFNAWNCKTETVCQSLNLSIDTCYTGFDTLIRDMTDYQIEMLAWKQSFVNEVFYHPHLVTDLEKFELYLRSRRKYNNSYRE